MGNQSYVSKAKAEATSLTMPTHQAGDLLVMFAYRNGSTTAPTVPSGWVSKGVNTGTTCAVVVAQKTAKSSSETSGTWTNATGLICIVYRGVHHITRHAGASGTGTTVNYSGITTMEDAGNSWGLRFAFHDSTNTSLETAPTAFSNREDLVGADEAAVHDTNGSVASVSFGSVNVGGTSGNWLTQTIEIVQLPDTPNPIRTYSNFTDGNPTIASVVVEDGEALLVFAGIHQGDITAVSRNSQSLTYIGQVATAFDEKVEVWYDPDPTVGTNDVTITGSGGSGRAGSAVVIKGQARTGQPVILDSDGDNTYLGKLWSVKSLSLLLAGCYSEAPLTLDTGSGFTEIHNLTGDSYENMATAKKNADTNGVDWVDWGQSFGARAAAIGVAIQSWKATAYDILLDSITNNGDSDVTSIVTSVVVGSHTYRFMAVQVTCYQNDPADAGDSVVTAMDYNGDNCTYIRVDTWINDRGMRQELWYIIAPDTGTHNLTITFTGNVNFIDVLVYSYYSETQALALDQNAGSGAQSSTASSVTTNITPTVNNNVILAALMLDNGDPYTLNSGQSNLANSGGSDYVSGSMKRQTTAGATSMGASFDGGADQYAHSVISIVLGAAGTDVNDQRGGHITGQDTANSNRSAVITGKDTANSNRAGHLVGQAAANDQRAGHITGTDTASSERAGHLTGGVNENDERAATLIGTATANDQRAGHITGKDTATAERAAKITGNLATNSERAGHLTGTDTASAERAATLIGTATDNDERGAHLTGVDTQQVSERGGHITGYDTTNAQRSAVLTGTETANSERAATLVGTETTSAERGGHLTGYDTDSDERAATITGTIMVSENRPAKITGTLSTNEERGGHITGKVDTNDERAAKITGVEVINDERSAHLIGEDTAATSRDLRLTGYDIANEEHTARLVGQATIAAEVLAHLFGKELAFDERGGHLIGYDTAFSERGARLTGKIIKGNVSVLPPGYGQTVIGEGRHGTPLNIIPPTTL